MLNITKKIFGMERMGWMAEGCRKQLIIDNNAMTVDS